MDFISDSYDISQSIKETPTPANVTPTPDHTPKPSHIPKHTATSTAALSVTPSATSRYSAATQPSTATPTTTPETTSSPTSASSPTASATTNPGLQTLSNQASSLGIDFDEIVTGFSEPFDVITPSDFWPPEYDWYTLPENLFTYPEWQYQWQVARFVTQIIITTLNNIPEQPSDHQIVNPRAPRLINEPTPTIPFHNPLLLVK